MTTTDASPEPVGPAPEVVGVTMAFDAGTGRASDLAALLARYVVLTRGASGCRTADLFQSATRPDRFVVVQKWASGADQRAHFDSEVMVAFARDALDLLAREPEIDLLDAVSAHDLR